MHFDESYLNSQLNTVLDHLLMGKTDTERATIIGRLLRTTETPNERDKDVKRKREKRTEAARIEIPDVVNPQRRDRCLKDPELFLKTYFADKYTRPFGKHHHQMIDTIVNRAKYGGRQAIAAPRGCGKSELVKGMLVYLVFAGLVRFPMPVAATTPHAGNLYEDFRKKLATNELLLADFPEVCAPIRDLEGAPLRAAKQHVDGQLTQIVWKAGGLSLPYVPGSPYGGVKMRYYGLDAAFRGVNVDGQRPDFVLVDDPETRESAKSLGQVDDRGKILDQDVAGLSGEDENLAIVVLTTIQNRTCLSFKLTDRSPETGKPAWNGLRFGMIEKWPKTCEDPNDESKLGLWGQYIAIRHKDQAEGDEHGLNAVRFYLDNRKEMDDGYEMLTDHFTPAFLEDGTQLTFSALQVAFNKIADTDLAAFRTEYQNDPEPVEEVERLSLTAAKVQSRMSKLSQGQIQSDTKFRTIGLDLGKYASHWTDIAWSENGCVGNVVDYGIMETHGLNTSSDNKAIETALIESMEVWADDVVAKTNADLVLIDSGNWKEAAYEICRRLGKPFFPAKGWDQGRFRMPKRGPMAVPFDESYARYQKEDRVWLYNVQTEHWKQWLQERFLTRTWDETGERVDGSLALFENEGDIKRHLSFAHHLVAEEERWIPQEGKDLKRVWYVKNRNNHWLDSTALACAAAGCLGVRLVKSQTPAAGQVQKKRRRRVQPMTNQYGQSFVATGR